MLHCIQNPDYHELTEFFSNRENLFLCVRADKYDTYKEKKYVKPFHYVRFLNILILVGAILSKL